MLPLLFTAGMTLFDTLDGAFMTVAYRWAFAEPVRKLFYNLAITGLSVAVALLIGTVQLVGMLHDRLQWRDPVTGWIAGLDLNTVGFLVVGLFVVVWPPRWPTGSSPVSVGQRRSSPRTRPDRGR